MFFIWFMETKIWIKVVELQVKSNLNFWDVRHSLKWLFRCDNKNKKFKWRYRLEPRRHEKWTPTTDKTYRVRKSLISLQKAKQTFLNIHRSSLLSKIELWQANKSVSVEIFKSVCFVLYCKVLLTKHVTHNIKIKCTTY